MRVRAIYKRELQSYFYTPVGYVFLGVFLAISGVIFIVSNISARSSELLTLLGQFSFLWMLLSPVLTMRLLAEERRQKTDQLLLTSPASVTAVVLGKFFAAVTVMLAAVLLSFAYVAILAVYGQVYLGEVFVGYLGFILQGCAFVALGLLVSGFSRNQITAAVTAFGVNFLLWLMDVLAGTVSLPAMAGAMNFLSLYVRYEPFLLGQLSFSSILYYLLFSALMLVVTISAQDARRWSCA